MALVVLLLLLQWWPWNLAYGQHVTLGNIEATRSYWRSWHADQGLQRWRSTWMHWHSRLAPMGHSWECQMQPHSVSHLSNSSTFPAAENGNSSSSIVRGLALLTRTNASGHCRWKLAHPTAASIASASWMERSGIISWTGRWRGSMCTTNAWSNLYRAWSGM